MKCAQCHFDSPTGMKFCGQCGAKLEVICPQCSNENPSGFKFCGECGYPLGGSAPNAAASPSPSACELSLLPQRSVAQGYTPPYLADSILQTKTALEGERKQVTVLFCDLVGSTALAEKLGPETMHLLLNRFFELALSEIHRYEGTINQFLGDGFMALFGAPITHEDHARRAVLSALGLQKLLKEHQAEFGERYGIELNIRMGLNTGWVVVGGIGDQLRRDYTAVGDTTNLAARLQQTAQPGDILVSEATRRFLQGAVQLETLELVRMKGKEAPILTFRVLGIGTRLSDEAVLDSAALSPFSGRKREIEILDELRERAASGEGQVVGIAGEAGTGKSRLLYEFRHRSWEQPAVCLAGRCLSYGSGVPYLPLLYMLRSRWGILETDDPAVVTVKVREGLEKTGIRPEESLPYLLKLLGGKVETEGLANLSPQAFQTRTFAVLRQWLLNVGRGRLVVLEIEDLHWIDETSEDFLSFLVEGLTAARMLLLMTYRPGYRPRWIEKSYATQIALRRLTEPESHVVVEAILHNAKLPEDLVSTILSKAEGNPLFLEELTHTLLERPDVSVPDTIQGVLMARVDRLPEDHKRLLQTASILGREFRMTLLTAVWNQPGTLASLLADLRRWEFLYEEPTAEDSLYFFRHVLTQEAVYQTLLTNRRRSLHRMTGEAFETLYADCLDEVYDRLAHHYSQANDSEKAVSYLSLFAEKSARGYAHVEAVRALQEALVHAGHLPEAERDRRVLELIFQLAHSLLPLARFSETLELLVQYRETLERLQDPALAGRYFFWLAHTYSYLGNQEEAASNARLSIEEARLAGDTFSEGRAWYVLCRDAFWSGRFSEGIGYGRQAVDLLEKSADPWWQGQAYWVAGFHHYVLGQFEEAFDRMKWAEAIWRALQDPRLDPSWSMGYFHASLGEWDLGIEECQGGLERAQDPLNTAAALGFLGYAYLEKGDIPRAMEALERAVGPMREAGMQQLLGWFYAFLAETYLLADRPDEAQELAQEALTTTESVGFRYGSGMAQRALGRIARATGDREGTEMWLGQALESFRSIQAPFEVGRTRLELALAAGTGAVEAGRQLGEARRIFAELRLQHFMEKVEHLAGELHVALEKTTSG